MVRHETAEREEATPAWVRIVNPLAAGTTEPDNEGLAQPPVRRRSGLYSIFLQRLANAKQSKDGLVEFPDAFEKLCRNFSITKAQCWEVLLLLNDLGVVEIVPGHGVRLRPDGPSTIPRAPILPGTR